MKKDQLGLSYSGVGSAQALDDYLAALDSYYGYIGDYIALVDRALADSPQFVMAHLLKAYMVLIGSNAEMVAVSAHHHAAAAALPMNDRERMHVRALGLALENRLWESARAFEDLSVDYPLDGLALHVGAVVDYLIGDSRMLRDRIGRAMPDWSPDMHGYHGLLGSAAFGLEETGQYARAEAMGLEALAFEPRNGWATHAVAHVFEMENRRREGAVWMRSRLDDWSKESGIAVHNWWHLALFHLGLGETDEVLKLYDGPIFGTPSAFQFDMVDASALLWRLQLKGVDVGGRWHAIADAWEKDVGVGGESTFPFNDWHAMMAFVGAGRDEAAVELLAAQGRGVAAAEGDGPMMLREVGQPVTLAVRAFGEGRYRDCVELLRPVRNRAHRFGGSHAQRDLIDQTLIEAARRDGQRNLVIALEAERGFAKPEADDVTAMLSRAA